MKEPCRKLKIIIKKLFLKVIFILRDGKRQMRRWKIRNVFVLRANQQQRPVLIYFKNGNTQYFYAEMVNHDFITKGAFLWQDPDLDLWYKIIKITVHEKNDVSDKLSENSKKYAILRLCTWVSELFPELFVLLHGLLARTIH